MPFMATVLGNEHIAGTGDSSPRVVVYGIRAQEIHLHNPHAIAEMLSWKVLAAFYKCFHGADRIRALDHLMDLTNLADAIEESGDDEAAGYTRDRLLVGFLLAGTMREVAIALNELHGTGVTRDASLRDSWTKLNVIRKLFNDDYARNIRNNFAMHLGRQHHFVGGIMCGKTETVKLFETSGKPHGGLFREPLDALLRAHGIRDGELFEFVKRTKEAHKALPQLLIDLFRDVLALRGVPVQYESGRRLVEPAATRHRG